MAEASGEACDWLVTSKYSQNTRWYSWLEWRWKLTRVEKEVVYGRLTLAKCRSQIYRRGICVCFGVNVRSGKAVQNRTTTGASHYIRLTTCWWVTLTNKKAISRRYWSRKIHQVFLLFILPQAYRCGLMWERGGSHRPGRKKYILLSILFSSMTHALMVDGWSQIDRWQELEGIACMINEDMGGWLLGKRFHCID